MRIIIILSLFGFLACKSNTSTGASKETPKQINALNDSITTKKADFDKEGKRLIAMLNDYATANPKDSLADDYLFEVGQHERSFHNYNNAMKAWDKVVKDYPESEKLPDVLFYQGFVAENEMQDLPKAKAIYEDFLKRWPNHTYAASVRTALENLGKSPEEMYKAIKAKQSNK